MESLPTTVERRQSPRGSVNAGTYAQRLSRQDMPTMRVQLVDVSESGVGVTSLIPLTAGERLALALQRVNAEHECALCRVQYAGKSVTGQFRAGLTILEKQPGELARLRVPAAWTAEREIQNAGPEA